MTKQNSVCSYMCMVVCGSVYVCYDYLFTSWIFTGLVISAIYGDENTALQVSIATFYPVLVLSGKPPLLVSVGTLLIFSAHYFVL